MKKIAVKVTSLLMALIMICGIMTACNKNSDSDDDKQSQQSAEDQLGNGSSSNFDVQDGVKLKIRTSSDYYIDGEDIVMTAVLTNDTDGYIPVMSPVGSRGKEGALEISAKADGYELACLKNGWGETMPVSMSDVNAPYYFLLEPGMSLTCNYIYLPEAVVGEENFPLWKTTVLATLNVQIGEKLDKRQGGLEALSYSTRSVTVEITFDGTSDKPQA